MLGCVQVPESTMLEDLGLSGVCPHWGVDKAKPVLNLRRCAGPRVPHVVVVDFKDPVIGDLLFVIRKAAL